MSDLNFSNVMIGSAQSEVLGEFYARILDRPADMKEESWYGWHLGAAAWLSVGEHSEVKDQAKEPERVILNFERSAKRVRAHQGRWCDGGQGTLRTPGDVDRNIRRPPTGTTSS